ncbi:MAG: hypothetical protein O9266_08265 [Porphyrobacter sp.]|jgi:hypothetical protein|nr:hypothetical protein [Porphyrobacter sp.]
MRKIVLAVVAGSALASPAWAEPNLEKGFDGALRGCEEWVLNPASWAEGTGPFIEAVGLGDQMKPVGRVEEVNLLPPQLRRANHYWRINSAPNAGYVLVVSDQLPMCHITGGGGVDLQPSIESVLASDDFKLRWQSETSTAQNGMTTSVFRSRKEPALSIIISRAAKTGERLDRVQVLATAVFDIGS